MIGHVPLLLYAGFDFGHKAAHRLKYTVVLMPMRGASWVGATPRLEDIRTFCGVRVSNIQLPRTLRSQVVTGQGS